MSYKYIIDHIPKNTPNTRRPGLKMIATTLTIHNTGNSTSTARNERAWLTNPTNNRVASYHIAIDEKEAIEVIPLNEVAYHAGDRTGNTTSIGIEICESGNYKQTLENATDLVAKMLHERKWGIDKLRRHYDWSGKICPRLMYNNGKWTDWEQFKQQVQVKLDLLKNPSIKGDDDKLHLTEWQWNDLENAVHKLNLNNTDQWLDKIKKRELTVSELTWLNTIVISRNIA